MNIFIAIMLVFAAAGLLDEILGGKLGLMPNLKRGLPRWAVWRCPRSDFMRSELHMCRRMRKRLRRRQSICHLIRRSFQAASGRRDMGALGMAQKLAATPALAAFTGAMVAGSLGMTVGYQLPVFWQPFER